VGSVQWTLSSKRNLISGWVGGEKCVDGGESEMRLARRLCFRLAADLQAAGWPQVSPDPCPPVNRP
jgi:hypothetical protein